MITDSEKSDLLPVVPQHLLLFQLGHEHPVHLSPYTDRHLGGRHKGSRVKTSTTHLSNCCHPSRWSNGHHKTCTAAALFLQCAVYDAVISNPREGYKYGCSPC